ncbi:MAG: hypothetical protein ACI8T1_004381 [Verrucomicrobiales bacterium]
MVTKGSVDLPQHLHVLSGNVTAGDALNAGHATTVNGQPVTIAVTDGVLKVNGATLRVVDVECTNGVIHVIDSVLFPTGKAEETKQSAAPSATKGILAAIDKGVPLYNQSDPQACAEVYQVCVEGLVKDDQVDEDMRSALANDLTKAQMTKSPDTRAWLLRQNLDGALAHLMRAGH